MSGTDSASPATAREQVAWSSPIHNRETTPRGHCLEHAVAGQALRVSLVKETGDYRSGPEI